MDEQLGRFALEELKKKNVEVILNNRVIDVDESDIEQIIAKIKKIN